MKFIVRWDNPPQQTDEQAARAFKVFSSVIEGRVGKKAAKNGKKPQYEQIFGRLDSRGGFILVEAADAAELARDAAKFYSVAACEIIPVLDIREFAQIGREAMEFRAQFR